MSIDAFYKSLTRFYQEFTAYLFKLPQNAHFCAKMHFILQIQNILLCLASKIFEKCLHEAPASGILKTENHEREMPL